MRCTVALAILVGALALPRPATAQRVELAGRVTASRTVLAQRRVGEPRYVAISDLFYRDRNAHVEVLDLATQTVIQVTARRAALEKRFGAGRGATAAPQGEVVVFRGDTVGLALAEPGTGARRFWYAELDASSGKIVRSAALAMIEPGEQLSVVGADPTGAAAWFAITERADQGRNLVLRRLDLGSFAIRDPVHIPLPLRAAGGDREHGVHGVASADFSRFAVVEYVEDGVKMAPGHIYIADPGGASFAVPAPAAAYGIAFSGDGRYIYVGSAQRGTISRIDVAGRRIDKQVAAPRYLHHLVISPRGTRLFAFASSSSYAVYDLPDLRARSDAAHPAGLAPAMLQLYGNGIASLDGGFLVVPDAEDRGRPARDRSYLIARLGD